MKFTLARYRTRPERTLENQRLIEKVFEELREKSPPGLRYVALKVSDGSFLHFHMAEEGDIPVTALDAFKFFRSGINERCLEQPQVEELPGASIVGNYRVLSD
jgi:hypothetical protein